MEFDLGFGQLQNKSVKRGTIYSADKDKILSKQKGKCAGKNCSKNHGKKLPVNIRSHFDHKKPLAIGGKDIPSNLQALCANCHQEKTRIDRKLIAESKKGPGKTQKDKDIFGLPLVFGKPPKGRNPFL